MSPSKTEVLEQAHFEAMDRILHGHGNNPGLIKEVQDLKDWRLEERTTRRVLVTVFTLIFSLGSGVVAFALTNLKDAVLSRPVVVIPSVKP